MQSYVIIFKDGVPDEEIKHQAKELSALGGNIAHWYTTSFLRGFSAQLPNSVAERLRHETEEKQHPCIDYIEPDQPMRMQ
ncbi:Uncharacterized protein MSYG_3725 [Malassezia sympodialis ATCC 42132]|uniref:Inhibitor I9 domain-containing protein n=1 Tax=Malassezia sympodialis (strain ATCC 42132) TaxID=1230383 RepID=A0A1M8AA68_MALS4|nr:Uncharacterized protein MSYG_3725 [Malassezia sympodialis ATCC 42132]